MRFSSLWYFANKQSGSRKAFVYVDCTEIPVLTSMTGHITFLVQDEKRLCLLGEVLLFLLVAPYCLRQEKFCFLHIPSYAQ